MGETTVTTNVHTGITTEPLDQQSITALVDRREHGAVITFVGNVRNHDSEADGEVVALEYSAHPDAETILHDVITQHVRAHSSEIAIAAYHRVGTLSVGETALLVCISAAHRDNLFDLCQKIVEDIKAQVPIWKKQFTSTGGAVWVGIS